MSKRRSRFKKRIHQVFVPKTPRQASGEMLARETGLISQRNVYTEAYTFQEQLVNSGEFNILSNKEFYAKKKDRDSTYDQLFDEYI